MNLSICLSPCPFLCPYDWKTHWKEGRNHCDFVLLTPPLIGPEPRFDSPQPPVPQPVGHIREKTHHLKSKPELDSAQEQHLQHKVRIQNTTSLQTSPSRQVQELTGPVHHTTRWRHQDRKTNSHLTRQHHPRYCAQFVQHTIQCLLLQNEPCGPFQSSCLLCLVHGGLGRPKHTIAVYSVSFLVPAKTVCRSSRERDVHFGEVDIPEFQLKESLTSLFLSPRCLYKRVFVFDHFVFRLRADRGVYRGDSMIVTSYSRFLTSGVPDTSESLGHFAESTLLSHDIVSDDLSWSSSDLIIRLYFLVSVRHRHRCERAFSQDTKEALNSSCIFKVLRFAHSNHFFRMSLQIGPQTSHCTFLFTRFSSQL